MPRSTPFAQPVDCELRSRFVRDELINLHDCLLAMPSACAGRASHRTALRRFGHAATIAIAVFCVIWFAGQLLRAVLS